MLDQTSARCQPAPSMRAAMSGGVIAEPRLSPMLCAPCTNDHCRTGNQVSKTPLETGKIPPCAAPRSSCEATSARKSAVPPRTSGAAGTIMTAMNAATPKSVSAWRAPRR